MEEAINFLLDNFYVMVWSSMRRDNLDEMVKHCFKDRASALLGVWDQSHCTQVHDQDLEPGFRAMHSIAKGKPIFLKEISSIKNDPQLERFYPDNVLLIDDSQYKVIRNPKHTAIHPEPWKTDRTTANGFPFPHEDRELVLLCHYLKGVSSSRLVTSFVRDIPFALWKAFDRFVVNEHKVARASEWWLQQSVESKALAEIWEWELCKARGALVAHLVAVATNAAEMARAFYINRGPCVEAEDAMDVVHALWPIFPRAVHHTLDCRDGPTYVPDPAHRIDIVIDTFNVAFDPWWLLGVRPGIPLQPLWEEVVRAAREDRRAPPLAEVLRLWDMSRHSMRSFAWELGQRLVGNRAPQR